MFSSVLLVFLIGLLVLLNGLLVRPSWIYQVCRRDRIKSSGEGASVTAYLQELEKHEGQPDSFYIGQENLFLKHEWNTDRARDEEAQGLWRTGCLAFWEDP